MSSHNPRPTSKDVAELAGVSIAVVSYVLNGGPRPVAADTRVRVLEAVARLQYRPNASAKALKLNRTNVIGLLLPDIANPFFAEFAKAVEGLAHTIGLSLIIADTDLDHSREPAQIKSLMDRGVDGLILFGIVDRQLALEALDFGLRIVSMDWQFAGGVIGTVLIEDEAAARAAVDHLRSHGHTRIGYIGGPPGPDASEPRLEGWEAAMDLARLPTDGLTYAAARTREGGRDVGIQLLSQEVPPSAVVISSDIQAVGFLAACDQMGISVPADVAIISFDGTKEAAFSHPPLSSITLPVDLLAAAVIRRFTGIPDADHELVPFSLTLRDSCGC